VQDTCYNQLIMIFPVVIRLVLQMARSSSTMAITSHLALCGLIVACFSLGPRFVGSNQAEDDVFSMAIKIRSKTSFRGEVKSWVP
jgi:hypothetical protein